MTDSTIGKWAWHVHHTRLFEKIGSRGLGGRTHYIQTNKPTRERPRRLRLLKIIQEQDLVTALSTATAATYSTMDAPTGLKVRRTVKRAIEVLHQYECKDCPWDGETIFPKKKKVKK